MGSKVSVNIGGLEVGGNTPVRVESMLKTFLSDVEGCAAELEALHSEGCELVRVAFPERALSDNLKEVVSISPVPIMADIHFDSTLALAALDAGCPSVRINPGNMRKSGGIKELVARAKDLGAVIRIGANGGSLNNEQLKAAGGDRGAALVTAVEEQLAILREEKFHNIIISAKSTNVYETVRANEILASRYEYPFHIGMTEAGAGLSGTVKGAAGISLMLSQGIGDTLRVSLTEPGVQEVRTGYAILSALGMRKRGAEVISCPTCGRRKIDVASLAAKVKDMVKDCNINGITIAVMGCEVNGPREAASADLGVAGTPGGFVLFKKGKPYLSGTMEDMPEIIKRELNSIF
jgi:(E)-4-hydroxy-3-methylbut-2-enyl-diphosphate synthase